jgi:protein TonB
MIIRYGLSVAIGVFVTLLLFYIMQALIQSGKRVLTDDGALSLVDFVRLKEDQQLQTKKRKPKKPPPPDEPPPDIPPQQFNVAVDPSAYSMSNVDLSLNISVSGGGFGITDGDYLPIVKVQPVYPRRALSRGMAGWVIVEFVVNEQGMVENPVIVANCGMVQNARSEGECEDHPSNIFDSAAMKAALKFKYKPKIIDGVPTATGGVQNKITFELTEG